MLVTNIMSDPPDHPPRPSRPKAGLGLVMMMMMMMMTTIMMRPEDFLLPIQKGEVF